MSDIEEMLVGARERKLTDLETIQCLRLQVVRMQKQLDKQAEIIRSYQAEAQSRMAHSDAYGKAAR